MNFSYKHYKKEIGEISKFEEKYLPAIHKFRICL